MSLPEAYALSYDESGDSNNSRADHPLNGSGPESEEALNQERKDSFGCSGVEDFIDDI